MSVVSCRAVSLAMFVGFVAFVVNKFYVMNEFYRLFPLNSNDESCRKIIPDFKAFEDIAAFSDGGFVAIASDHSHFKFTYGKSMQESVKEKIAMNQTDFHVVVGVPISDTKIEVFDGQKVELVNFPKVFMPHGIATYGSLRGLVGLDKSHGTVKSSEKSKLKHPLFVVVNHRDDFDTLEMFEIVRADEKNVKSVGVSDLKLVVRHVFTLRDDVFVNLNDCVFYDAKNIFCTNWRSNPTGTNADLAEVYLQQKNNYIVHCKVEETSVSNIFSPKTKGLLDMMNVKCKKVAEDLMMPNGIEISDDKKNIFVVESNQKLLLIYRVVLKAGNVDKLHLIKTINTFALCDNANWGSDAAFKDDLLLGCHPKGFSFIYYSLDPKTRTAPCEVIKLKNLNKEVKKYDAYDFSKFDKSSFNEFEKKLGSAGFNVKVETMYLDPLGQQFSACSAAAYTGESLFIGAVHEHGILQCEGKRLKPSKPAEELREIYGEEELKKLGFV